MSHHASTGEIRDFILKRVRQGHKDISAAATHAFGLTRQAINRHIKKLETEGLLVASGKTKSRTYALRPVEQIAAIYMLDGHLEEHVPWDEKIKPLLSGVPSNVFEILQYGFTEMLNNAIDHSGGDQVTILMTRTALDIEIRIIDFGIGIFRKIKDDLGLADELQAILELSKGRLTTDPEHHTGEGIFFTSRMFDDFSILSGSLYFTHQPANDWLIEDSEDLVSGTSVKMNISVDSNLEYKAVFDRFAGPERDYRFSRTHVPVKLMQYGEQNLVSRSQAKRLLARFDIFEEVILDFEGVKLLGQGFADEVFRVYAKAHPTVKIIAINASPQVQGMISHSLPQRSDPQKTLFE